MNRIREINNKYQLLINNNYTTNPSIELTLGDILNKEQLKNYEIKHYDNLQDAINEAYNYPPINFNKIHSDSVDIFKRLNLLVNNILLNENIIIKPKLLLPNEIKNMLFDRILKHGNRFNFYFNFNDIITFDLIHSHTNNLLNIINILKKHKELQIIRIEKTLTHIKLIGLTENNLTYEIRLWTSILYDFMNWIYYNNKNLLDYMDDLMDNLQKQKIIDNY